MIPAVQPSSKRTASRLLGLLAVFAAVIAGSILLAPRPLADVFFSGWVLFGVGIALLGGFAARTNRRALVWATALLSTGLSVVGLWSIGLLFAPSAILLFGSALLLQSAGPSGTGRTAIVANSPTVPEVALKALAGIGSVLLGGGLVYVGAVTRDLFDACASETLACTIDNTHWDAVGVTVIGLVAVALGVWLTWKQLYIARVLATTPVE